jgi:hypothetical protein
VVDDIVRTTLICSLKVQRSSRPERHRTRCKLRGETTSPPQRTFSRRSSLTVNSYAPAPSSKGSSMSTLKKFRATNVSTISVQHGFPMLLSLKRLGTRIMPSGKMVAEYHSDQLKATIILPMMFRDRRE